MSDGPHEYSYATEGARNLLRNHVPGQADRDVRSQALRALLEDARVLFETYRLESNWHEGSYRNALTRWWDFSRPGVDRRVTLMIVRGKLEVETAEDGAMKQCTERPRILFDPPTGMWVGPETSVRDLSREGAPPVHLSALEELTRFILELLDAAR